jgi:holliday junction DNA helicase RuvA
MIAFITGRLAAKTPTEIVVETGGIGYQISVPLSTSGAIGSPGEQVRILTHLHVREDAMQLYGFATDQERELFRLLISVSGIGPRLAQGILSGISAAELQSAILSGNLPALTAIPGIGRKTAERMVLELRGKVGAVEAEAPASAPATSMQLKNRSEALVALMSLGYTRASAEKALQVVLRDPDAASLSTEALIKRSLQHASRT